MFLLGVTIFVTLIKWKKAWVNIVNADGLVLEHDLLTKDLTVPLGFSSHFLIQVEWGMMS